MGQREEKEDGILSSAMSTSGTSKRSQNGEEALQFLFLLPSIRKMSTGHCTLGNLFLHLRSATTASVPPSYILPVPNCTVDRNAYGLDNSSHSCHRRLVFCICPASP